MCQVFKCPREGGQLPPTTELGVGWAVNTSRVRERELTGSSLQSSHPRWLICILPSVYSHSDVCHLFMAQTWHHRTYESICCWDISSCDLQEAFNPNPYLRIWSSCLFGGERWLSPLLFVRDGFLGWGCRKGKPHFAVSPRPELWSPPLLMLQRPWPPQCGSYFQCIDPGGIPT